MFRLIPITQWFYGKDILIDLASFLILLVLLFYAIKFYKINNSQKKYRYLISSFALLAVSFLAKVLSHFVIYYNDVETKHIGIISFTYQTINHSNILVFWGLFAYRILSLFAIYLFYLIYAEKMDLKNQSLMIFLLMLVAYLGQAEYYMYYITLSVLLLINIISLRERYLEKKSVTTKYLLIGFGLLLLSQIFFIFIFVNPFIYLTGEILQIIGYCLILIGFIRVMSKRVVHYTSEKKRTN